MRKNDAIMELVAGYEAYAGAEDLNVSASSDVPASTTSCISATATIIVSTIIVTWIPF